MKYALTDEQVREAHRLWKSGKTQDEVARQFFVNKYTLLKSFRRCGLPGIWRPRPVKNLTTGERYPTIVAAAKAHRLHPENIRRVCNGERQHCGGYAWAYDEVGP